MAILIGSIQCDELHAPLFTPCMPSILWFRIYTFSYTQYVFDYKEGDVFACVSDLGWLSGHTSVVYGPLCNGATTVLFEGTATYPNEGKRLA